MRRLELAGISLQDHKITAAQANKLSRGRIPRNLRAKVSRALNSIRKKNSISKKNSLSSSSRSNARNLKELMRDA
jgi:hypothetical protein